MYRQQFLRESDWRGEGGEDRTGYSQHYWRLLSFPFPLYPVLTPPLSLCVRVCVFIVVCV